MGDTKWFGPLWHTQKPEVNIPCDTSLMCLQVAFTGIYPAATCTWGECYDTDEARSLTSLLIWFLECARSSNLVSFVEVLYDETWHKISEGIDPQFIRVWLPIENDMQLAEFLEVANQSVRPLESDKKSSKKRGRPQREDGDEDAIIVGHKIINSPKILATAVMNMFMGLSSRYVDEIEFNIPGDDDDFRPKSPMKVFSAEALFNDERIRKQWENHRVPEWQSNLMNYIQDGDSFTPPYEACTIPGIMRQFRPEAPWISHNGGTMDALLNMSHAHVIPPRADIEEKLDERCRTAGADLVDEVMEGMSDEDFYNMFSHESEMGSGSLMDPCGHSPIIYRDVSDNNEFGSDTNIMEILYPVLLQCQSENKRRLEDIMFGVMEGTIDNAEDELDRYACRVANSVRMQAKSPCSDVPPGFFAVSNELRTKLFPKLKRSKRNKGAAWDYWTLDYAINQADADMDHESLILKQLMELAASSCGLDLTQSQIVVWALLYFALMMVNHAHWGPCFVLSITGHSGIGKSHVGDKVSECIPDVMSSPMDGQSEKAKFLSDDVNGFVKCDERSDFTLIYQTIFERGYLSYKQYEMIKEIGTKRRRSGTTADRLKTIIANKTAVYFLAGNFAPSIAIKQRSVEVDAVSDDTKTKFARVSGDRINGKHNEESRADAFLMLKTWMACSIVPHMIEANSGIIGGFEEGISHVFFVLYKHILVDKHGFPELPVRLMKQITLVAKGIMVGRLTTVMYRRSTEPWFVSTESVMTAMQNGGAVLRISDMLASYALIHNSADKRQTRSTVMGALKSLVEFEDLSPDRPKFDTAEQYYILSADKKTLVETVKAIIPDTGVGIIQERISEFLEMKYDGTQNRILEYSRTGEAKLFRKAADEMHVVALAENAFVKTLKQAVSLGLNGRDRGVSFSYCEKNVLVSKKTYNDIMDGLMQTPYSNLCDLRVWNRQGAYFWAQKGLLRDYEQEGGDNFPACAVLEDNPHVMQGFERVIEGGIFDTRNSVTEPPRWPYKTRSPKACKWEIDMGALKENYFEHQIYASAKGVDGLRELWNMAYYVSRPNTVGKKVFFKLSPTCDLDTEATEFITLQEPSETTIRVLNPHRGQKQGALEKKESNSILGDDEYTVLSKDFNAEEKLITRCQARNATFAQSS